MVMPCDRESQDSDQGNVICALLITRVIICDHKIKNIL